MNIITVISDRKPGDFLLGRLKGHIHKNIEEINVIDFALGIPSFNIQQAGFVVKYGYKDFPENTVHIIGVDSEKNENQSHLAIKAQNQYFVCADNGIIALVFSETDIEKVIKFPVENILEYKPSSLLLADIAIKIINNKNIFNDFPDFREYKRKISSKPTFGENFINGNIIYVDSYKNGVTNIDKNIFDSIGQNRKFLIYAGGKKNVINKISINYNSVSEGEIEAIFNSYELLEIAMNKGKIASLFNFTSSTIIRIEFYD
jgi:S-adenosylmethionine hydrolase